jgi:hypothetical protein
MNLDYLFFVLEGVLFLLSNFRHSVSFTSIVFITFATLLIVQYI